MLFIKKEQPYPEKEYSRYLTERAQVFLNNTNIKKKTIRYQKLYESLKKNMELTLSAYFTLDTTNQIDYYLAEYLTYKGVPGEYLPRTQKTNRVSLKKEVIDELLREEYETPIIEIYQKMKEYKTKQSQGRKFTEEIEKFCEETTDNFGNTISRTPFSITKNENRRNNTKEPNIIGKGNVIENDMVAPEGFVMISGDFPQIDGKGAIYVYLSTPEAMELMRTEHDTYTVFKKLVNLSKLERAKQTLNEVKTSSVFVDTAKEERFIRKSNKDNIEGFKDKEERDKYKVNALATTYGKKFPDNPEDLSIVKDLRDMLDSNDKYNKITKQIKRYSQNGLPVIAQTRKGYKRLIVKKDYGNDSVLTSALNSPIQSCSSEIIAIFICEFLRRFREDRGYTVDDIYLSLNRHDEPIFLCRKEVYEKNKDILIDLSTILVEGWYPFKIEWIVGYSYKIPDEELTGDINDYIEPDDIFSQAEEYMVEDNFEPIEVFKEFYVTYRRIADESYAFMIGFYLPNNNKINLITQKVDNVANLDAESFLNIVYNIIDLAKVDMNHHGNIVIFNENFSSSGAINKASDVPYGIILAVPKERSILEFNDIEVVFSKFIETKFPEYFTDLDEALLNKQYENVKDRFRKYNGNTKNS